MKSILLASLTCLLAVLCGCQGLSSSGTQQSPGQMATGDWELVLQNSGTQNTYVESNVSSTSTAGTYNDQGNGTVMFSLDSSAYYADPGAGGGYAFGPTVTSLSFVVNSKEQVTGTLTAQNGSTITFTGTVAAGFNSITGTFTEQGGTSGQFTASVAQALTGYYLDVPNNIGENISSGVVAEYSNNGSGNYNLEPQLGNFGILASDVPQGGNGTVTFWNSSGVCNGNQCALWLDNSTGNLWVFMNNANTSQVIDVLSPPA